MNVIETDRLVLRKLTIDDAVFILDLLNQPSFILRSSLVRLSINLRWFPVILFEKIVAATSWQI